MTYLEGGTTETALQRVSGMGACDDDDQYYLGVEGDPGTAEFNHVFLCPNTCTRVQADDDAGISVGFGCLGQ